MSATCHDNASPGSPSTEHLIRRNSFDGHSKRAWCVAPLGNERVVSVSDDDNFIIVWKLGLKKEERHWDHNGATSVAVSHDGKYIVSGGSDGDLQLWDVESGDNFSGPWKLHSDKVWSITWSPDGSRIASCSEDSTFIIWNARPDSPTGKPFLGPIPTEQNAVYTIAYCPAGTKLATGGDDSTIKIWDAETGCLQVTLDNSTKSVSSVAWTKDRVISGSLDKTTRVWDISNSEQKAVKKISHPAAIKHIAVSEHFIASASHDHIYLTSLATYEPLPPTFEIPKGDEPNSIALSGDENTMFACTERGKVYFWNIGEIRSGMGNEVCLPLRLTISTLKDGDPHESPSFQSQSGPNLPETRNLTNILKQIVAHMRETVVSIATGRICRRSATATIVPAQSPSSEPPANVQDFGLLSGLLFEGC